MQERTLLQSQINNFLSYCLDTNKSISTVSLYKQVLETFVSWIRAEHPEVTSVTGLSQNHLKQFRRHLRLSTFEAGQEMSLGTQAKYFSILRSWIRYCRDYEGLPVISTDEISIPLQSRKIPLSFTKPLLSVEEAKILLSQPDRNKLWGLRDVAIISLLLSTKLRVSNICSLNRDDLREELLGKQPFLPLKVPNKNYFVNIEKGTQILIKNYLEKRQDKHKPLFIHHKPGQKTDKINSSHRITRQMINRMLEKYSLSAGIPFSVSPDNLRNVNFTITELSQ